MPRLARRVVGAAPEKPQQLEGASGVAAVSVDTRRGSFYPRGSRLPGSFPAWIALNSR